MHRQVNGLDLLLLRSVQGKIRRTLISENARHVIITNRYEKKLRVHLSTLSTGVPFPPKPHQQP